MKLYSIRHKLTGKYYNGHGTFYYSKGPYGGQSMWSETPGLFLKTPDGVINNLKRLGCEIVQPLPQGDMNYSEWQKANKAKWFFWSHNKAFDNFDPARLSDIEVIVTKVSVLGEEQFDAQDFLGNMSELVIQ